jgi:hypothetical protein
MKANEIPETIREMLWVAAESGDPGVVAEFEQRYPQYRVELARVRAMVEAMRVARPVAVRQRRFELPARAASGFPSRLALAAGIVLGLALAGYAAFRVTLLVQKPDPDQTPQPASVVRDQPPSGEVGTRDHQTRAPEPAAPGLRQGDVGTTARPFETEKPTAEIAIRGDASLFEAIAAIKGAGIVVHVDPDVRDASLNLAPDTPDGLLVFKVDQLPELFLELERRAPIRVQDLGPEGYLVVPLEKVSNVPQSSAQPTEAARGGG